MYSNSNRIKFVGISPDYVCERILQVSTDKSLCAAHKIHESREPREPTLEIFRGQ